MSSSTIYAHRSLQPSQPSQSATAHAHARLTEAFDSIRSEFDLLANDLGKVHNQREDFESKVAGQVQELHIIRQGILDLESQHSKVRQAYEDEIRQLRMELQRYQQDSRGESSYQRDRDRERERDLRERERDRLADRERDVKRIKIDRRPELPAPSAKGPANSQSLVPHHSQAPLPSMNVDDSPIRTQPTPFPFDPLSAPPEHRHEGSDWFAVFNPAAALPQGEGINGTGRRLDVNLSHTLMHESVVCCVRFSMDGKYLATGCNRTAQIFEVKTGAKLCVLSDDHANKTGDLYIRSVCFSPDGKYLATGAEDKQIRIWDIQKRKIRNVFRGHQQEIYSLDFSADGRVIVSGSGDKTARVWDMTTKESTILQINDSPYPPPAPGTESPDAGVTSVAISPSGLFVAAGSLDFIIRIWDVRSAECIARLKGHTDSVYSVAFTSDGRGLVSGSLDRSLKWWDVSQLGRGEYEDVRCLRDFRGHKDYVLSVAVSHDDQWVVSGSKDRGVQFWDAKTAEVQCMLQGHKNSVISIDLSRAGTMLATGSGDSQARIWSYSVYPPS